jgi:hypothetical protein
MPAQTELQELNCAVQTQTQQQPQQHCRQQPQEQQQPQELEGGEESEDGELPAPPPDTLQPLEQLEAEQRQEAQQQQQEAQPAVGIAGSQATATRVAVEEQQLPQHHATAELLPGHSGGSSQTLESAACGEAAQRVYQVPQQQYPQQQKAAQPGFSTPFNMQQPQLATAGSNGAGQPQDLDALQQESEQQPPARGMSLQPSWQASLASRASLDYGEL